jgi:hypothetical protein
MTQMTTMFHSMMTYLLQSSNSCVVNDDADNGTADNVSLTDNVPAVDQKRQ